MQYENLRNEIDKIDEEVISLLEKRFEIVKSIGSIKKQNRAQVFDEQREKERQRQDAYQERASIGEK